MGEPTTGDLVSLASESVRDAERAPVTFEDLVSRKRPTIETIPIALDPQLAEEYGEARDARDRAAARAAARPTDSDLQAQLWEAEEAFSQMEDRLVDADVIAYFTFRSIGRHAYEELVAVHPATPASRAKAKSQGMQGVDEVGVNLDTFAPALVAACLIEPKLSAAEVLALWRDDAWNPAELSALFVAATRVNGTRRTVALGKDSRKTRPSGRN